MRNSYSQLLSKYQKLTNNSETFNNTFGALMFNECISQVIAKNFAWKFLEKSATLDTVASQSDYQFPYDYGKLISLKTKEGDYWDVLTQVKSKDDWAVLTSVEYESDYITHYYTRNRTFSLFPTPSTSGNDIQITYRRTSNEIGTADYTTGTVTLTNGSTTVTGAGTTFTASMVGRYLKSGDGFWYRIAGFTSTTVLTLEDEYEGTTGAGQTYVIGDMSVLPEDHDDLPVYYAVAQYWLQNKDENRYQQYWQLYTEKLAQLQADYVNTTFAMTGAELDELQIDPNDYPQNIT
jgi:hypothetical protein